MSIDRVDESVHVYLINRSDHDLFYVAFCSAAFETIDIESPILFQSKVRERTVGSIARGSAREIDTLTVWDLEAVCWYRLELADDLHNYYILSFDLPKDADGYDKGKTDIGELDKMGLLLDRDFIEASIMGEPVPGSSTRLAPKDRTPHWRCARLWQYGGAFGQAHLGAEENTTTKLITRPTDGSAEG